MTPGAGFVILRDMQPLFSFAELDAIDTTQTSGFDQFFAQDAASLSYRILIRIRELLEYHRFSRHPRTLLAKRPEIHLAIV